MSSSTKRRDLKLTQKLIEMGFTEIYSIGKMLVLCTETQVGRYNANYITMI